jgi:hypothetical protein
MQPSSPSLRTALAAGAMGGVAEMLWVAAYSSVTPTSAVVVAQEVAASLFPGAASLAFAPLIGVGIHVLLSMALGVALAKLLLGYLVPRFGDGALMPAALAALAAIWAVNFFVVLPVLNVTFVTLMPLAATLTSKLLFGAGLVTVLRAQVMPQP